MKSDRVPLLKNEDVLIVPVHDELNDLETKQLEMNLLERVSKNDITGVVLDISSLEAMDLFTARKLVQMVNMITLMDVETVVCGMRPAVAITLTDMEVSFPNVRTALTLEQGLVILKRKKKELKVMAAQVLKVGNKKDVVIARKRISSVAKDIGMNHMKETEIRTAASELLSNMVRYAGNGTVTVETIEENGCAGVRASFEDNGPGIADLTAALSKGFSTGKSLGHGLSGCRNLVDSFEMESEPGKGTRVVITKWN